MTYGKEGEDNASMAGSPRTRLNGDTVLEDEIEERSPTPTPGGDFPAMKKRKSGTFWRRKSSLGMDAALGEKGSPRTGQNQNTVGVLGSETNGGHSVMDRSRGEDVAMNGQENGDSHTQHDMSKIESTRSISPPPQIPLLIEGGGGFGGEDLFKDIQ